MQGVRVKIESKADGVLSTFPPLTNANFKRGEINMASHTIARRCFIADCSRRHMARGLCQMHYSRLLRHGSPFVTKQITVGCSIENCSNRYSYFLAYGRWPMPQCLHACDNPRCVRPDHLRAGTHKDNMEDRDRRGRQAKGSKVAWAKLTEPQVAEIKRRHKTGVGVTQLTREYHVGKSAIRSIIDGKTWKHVREGVV